MVTKRVKTTVVDYVAKVLSSKSASTAGVVRRKRSTIPPHITLSALIGEVTGRGFKLLIGGDQVIIITDKQLTICD